MVKKIHYLSSITGYSACGREGQEAELTQDIDKVTCGGCRNTVTGQKAESKLKKLEGQIIVQVRLTDKALQNWQKIPRGERSKIVSNFLESITF